MSDRIYGPGEYDRACGCQTRAGMTLLCSTHADAAEKVAPAPAASVHTDNPAGLPQVALCENRTAT